MDFEIRTSDSEIVWSGGFTSSPAEQRTLETKNGRKEGDNTWSWQKLWVKALKMAFGSGHKISACSHERSFMTVSLFQI